MAHESIVESCVRAMIEAAKQKQESERQKDSQVLLDYYYSDADADIAAAFNKVFRKPHEKIKVSVNTVRKPINTLAQVMARPPTITVVNDAGEKMEREQELFDWLARRGQWFRKLRTADRWKKLLQTFHVRVHRSGPTPESSFLNLDLVPPSVSSVVQRHDNPHDLDAIMFQQHTFVDSPTTAVAQQFLVITPEHMYQVDGEGRPIPIPGNPGNVNPYERLTVVKVDDVVPMHDVYWNRGRRDLAEVNRVQNLMLTGLAAATWSQGWTQILATNVDESIVGTIGPDNAWIATGVKRDDHPPDIKGVQLSSDIDGMIKAAEFLSQFVALQNELPAQEFSVSGGVESGFAKRMNRAPLLEERDGDLSTWTAYLGDLFEIVKTVYAVEVENKRMAPPSRLAQPFSDEARLLVDYVEPKFPESPADEYELSKRKMDDGFAAPSDVMMALNPDLSHDEAIERLRQIKDETDELGDVLPQAAKSATVQAINLRARLAAEAAAAAESDA